MAISTVMLFFITESNIFIWTTILFITRLGAAAVEPMTDSYFFKHIKPENEEFISVYRSESPVAYIVAPILSLIVFYFVPAFNYIFLFFGLSMFAGVYLASTINRSDI